MSIRTLLLLVVGAAIVLLAALNWPALAAVQTISLGFTSVQGPLGLVLIGLTAVLAAVFLVYIFYLHSTVMFETRRHTKELQSQRELADRAEASRFTELRTFLDGARQEARAQHETHKQDLLSRITTLEAALVARIEQADNTSAAFFGELGDRIDRGAGHAPPRAVGTAAAEPPAGVPPVHDPFLGDVRATDGFGPR
ncbi:MAG: hypothetical protein GAK30_02810 [Paracidovorax wautersii]|uniref:Signal transduction histidine kinase n=1 Tax=Paracidovorax wautersii TaxID=1177982 RepID=A0A7V8JPN3_9BURK|nr:MAG: hypothetical protein GAK30_02810 [Paracidovorax wautersii]